MTNPQQNESKTRLAAIEWVVLRDVDDNYAPPDKPMLRIGFIGNNEVSLIIGRYEEDNKSHTFTDEAQIVVDAEPLFAALRAHVESRRRKPA